MAKSAGGNTDDLLVIDGLVTTYDTHHGPVTAVDDASINVREHEVLGLVGESGCGKTALSLSILHLLPRNGHIRSGVVKFRGLDLTSMKSHEIRNIRGRRISMVFQDTTMALDPVMRIGPQVEEALSVHFPDLPASEIHERAISALAQTGLQNPSRLYDSHPHMLSGGQCQRVLIAIATICGPELLIADEPTTALDVSVQAQILRLFHSYMEGGNMSMLFITHNPGVVAEMCDRVAVMYGGRIVEQCDVRAFFSSPMHPYTQNLLNSIPNAHAPGTSLPIVSHGEAPQGPEATGCPFVQRCSRRTGRCSSERPVLAQTGEDHFTACWVAH
jgi:oligopeptide/dipeptide ABC transporter ATP-binding protein